MKFQRGSIYKPEKEHYQIAGILLLIGCVQFLLTLNLAETQYPGYSPAGETLRDLGGAMPPTEPFTVLFNISMIIMGILFLAAVILILKSGGCRLFSSCLLLTAIGALGLGLLPLHPGFANNILTTLFFLFGSLAVLFSYRLGLNLSLVMVSLIIGFTSILSLIFYNWIAIYTGLGGAERLIFYPVILYLTALGGYLTCRGKDWVRIRFTRGFW